jgi:hypothetical protein
MGLRLLGLLALAWLPLIAHAATLEHSLDGATWQPLGSIEIEVRRSPTPICRYTAA